MRSFYDSNGDGIGDFRGLAAKLDYLQDLGVTAMWLLPFYPVAAARRRLRHRRLHRRPPRGRHAGRLRASSSTEAHRRGLRVITELVLNHTSDQHPWFQRARRAPPGSAERDFYVWSDTPERYQEARIIFKDFEPSNWAWDPVARAYFWHRFYAHQPDLNFENPAVHEALLERRSTSGSARASTGCAWTRCPTSTKREGTNCENLPADPRRSCKKLRAHVDAAVPGPHAAGRGQPVARGRRRLLRRRRRVPHELPLPDHAADVHVDSHGGSLPDPRHPGADAADPGQLPVGAVPAQPRRADAGDGDRRRARLHVPRLRARQRDAHQPRASAGGWRRWSATTAARWSC